ncbi:MAG: hypothetical protein ABJZ55_08110 [Fuerstiella sp.]
MKEDETQSPEQVSSPAAAQQQISFAAALERSLAATAEHQNHVNRPATPEALLKVARQYHGSELSVSPVLVALVAAETESLQLPSSSIRQEMCQAVAETIYNDSSSRQRMERLWHHLQQEQLS